jgi:hypothetical protein
MTSADEPGRPDRWLLTRTEHALVMAKHPANRLGFAVLLMFFRARGRFPRSPAEIDPAMVAETAEPLGIAVPAGYRPPLSGRTAERHRAEIRAVLGFREATVADAEALAAWLRAQVPTAGPDPDPLRALIEARCRTLSIEPPSPNRINRIVRAAVHAHDERFCAGIRDRLAPETGARLEALLHPGPDGPAAADRPPDAAPVVLLWLRGSPGRPSLASIQDELAKLELIRGIALPADLFDGVRPRGHRQLDEGGTAVG